MAGPARWPVTSPSTSVTPVAAKPLKWQGQCPHCGEWNSLQAPVGARPCAGARRWPPPARSCAALARRHGCIAAAAAAGHGRTGSRLRRRPGAGLGDPAGRRAGHRQVHAAAAGGRRAGARAARCSTPAARSRSRRWRCGRGAWGCATAQLRAGQRQPARRHPGAGRRAARGAAGRRFHPDHAAGRGRHAARLGRSSCANAPRRWCASPRPAAPR